MRGRSVAFGLLALAGIGLVGCGRGLFAEREPWRLQAEESCLAAKLVQPTAYMSRLSEINGPGTCGITYPFRATALGDGSVGLTNRLTLACPIIPELNAWLTEIVQPAAELYLGTTVSDIRAGSYSCRGRNNQPGARASEHAYGNAVDIMSFRLADGREVNVERGWRGEPEQQGFLREVFIGACRRFTTVLGPGSDAFHYNHLHLDLARHDPRGRRHVCKPILKFDPRIDPKQPAVAVAPRPRPAVRPQAEPAAPLEIDEDDDPYAVSSGPPPASRRTLPTREASFATAPPAARASVPTIAGLSQTAYAGEPPRSPRRPDPPGGAPLRLHPEGAAADSD